MLCGGNTHHHMEDKNCEKDIITTSKLTKHLWVTVNHLKIFFKQVATSISVFLLTPKMLVLWSTRAMEMPSYEIVMITFVQSSLESNVMQLSHQWSHNPIYCKSIHIFVLFCWVKHVQGNVDLSHSCSRLQFVPVILRPSYNFVTLCCVVLIDLSVILLLNLTIFNLCHSWIKCP